MPRYRWNAASLLGAVLFGFSIFAAAGKEKLVVKDGGVTFTVVTFDDGRSKPYHINFKVDDIRSFYAFGEEGDVTLVKVGASKYQVNDTGVIGRKLGSETKQSLVLPTASVLVEDNHELETLFDEGPSLERRRLYACSECEDTWDVMCGQGLQTVCELVGYGSPFDAEAGASIATLCDDFGDACSSRTGEDGCRDQCEGDSDSGKRTRLNSKWEVVAALTPDNQAEAGRLIGIDRKFPPVALVGPISCQIAPPTPLSTRNTRVDAYRTKASTT